MKVILFFILIFFGQIASYAQPSAGIKRIANAPLDPNAPTETEETILQKTNRSPFKTNFSIQDQAAIRSQLVKNPKELEELDRFLVQCIQAGAFPGCQVFASKNGQIIYKKSFGNFRYDIAQPVTDSSLYDIASITKILATTLAVMRLYEQKKINLNATVNTYLSNLSGTDKANLLLRDLLLHEAGLHAWIPFYKNTLDSVTLRPRADLYRTIAEKDFSVPVASALFLKNTYKETVWEEIINSRLTNKGRYVYSDLDFFFLEAVVEAVTQQNLDEYLEQQFYRPIGLHNILFNPWKKLRTKNCVPTEVDQYYRFQTIQGYVHDQGAAMMGGVAGHAGLFSNVHDVAVLMQMLNNGGMYQGRRYFQKETVELFTKYNSRLSRRGYGFDKPEKSSKNKYNPTSDLCSKSTFGHQGFTGTCTWADPETGIVFVFLSNRVYPSSDNRLINTLDVRTKAQSHIYKALGYGD